MVLMRILWLTGIGLAGLALGAGPFAPGKELLRFPGSLTEISGLEQSRSNPEIFWVHNDSGDAPRVYAVNSKGKLVGSYTLTGKGLSAEDWEDMSIGPAPGGGYYLYMADIGDNEGKRTSIKIHRVLEPRVSATQTPVNQKLSGVTSYEFVYEDGPRDAESFFVDPLTGDFYVVSKRELDGNRLYRAANPSSKGKIKLQRVGQFQFTGATAGAISPDGLQVVVRRYSSTTNPFLPSSAAATYWRRTGKTTTVAELLRGPGTTLPLVPEVQGEAIAFSADNKGFYSTGERGEGAGSVDSPLTYYAPLP